MASAEVQVVTPERVRLEYDIAGLGSRGAAILVDGLIQTALLAVAYVGLIGVVLAGRSLSPGDAPLGALVLAVGVFGLAVLLIMLGYFIIFEIAWSGQTPGKRLVGVRVIRDSGYPLRPIDAVVRNLLRLVDGLPTMYAVGVISMLLNARAKRLGDFAAGTMVVREASWRSAAPAAVLVPEPEAAGAAPRGPLLSSQDATLVRDLLLRRASLEPTARAVLAQRLAHGLGQRYQLRPEGDPEAFLERLV